MAWKNTQRLHHKEIYITSYHINKYATQTIIVFIINSNLTILVGGEGRFVFVPRYVQLCFVYKTSGNQNPFSRQTLFYSCNIKFLFKKNFKKKTLPYIRIFFYKSYIFKTLSSRYIFISRLISEHISRPPPTSKSSNSQQCVGLPPS